ncbi:MAG: CinA family protein [Kiritimatiellae bacterium]|nr:CinA family protein [Kiritimatiellia bacterium]
MADVVYQELAKDLISLCRDKHLTLGTAESCTGGMIAAQLTSVPGASDVFRGGVVSYATAVKHDVLGVPQRILDEQGPVCADCAEAMADGARRVLRCSLACSVTGFAGPGGGTEKDPVGVVYIGIASPRGTSARRFIFEGSRENIRRQTVVQALSLLLMALSVRTD